MNISIGQPVATGARAILAGLRTPDPFNGESERREMGSKEEYMAKLRDPRWQQTRLRVLDRDEWSCQFCFDSESTLHVHHLWYLRGHEPWEYPAGSLITLCESCHREETERLPGAVEALTHGIKAMGGTSFAFDALAQALDGQFTELTRPDGWDVLAHGIAEILESARGDRIFYKQIEERYYAALDKRNAEKKRE